MSRLVVQHDETAIHALAELGGVWVYLCVPESGSTATQRLTAAQTSAACESGDLPGLGFELGLAPRPKTPRPRRPLRCGDGDLPTPGRRVESADARQPSPMAELWRKAGEFAAAGASRIVEGSVPLPVLNHRRAVCLGIDADGNQVSARCSKAEEHKGHWYCRTCGCPNWRQAHLDGPKLRYPALACPLGKWSAMPGHRASQPENRE